MKQSIILNLVLPFCVAMGLVSCSSDDEPTNFMKVISIDPGSPATLPYGDFVIITYEYNIANAEGARMWVQPYTNGSISDRYLYSSSKIYTGNGGREVGISIDEGEDPINVDQLRIVMTTPDQDETLFETYINVDFDFAE